MYSELIGAPVTLPAAENQKYMTISVAGRDIRCTALHGLLPRIHWHLADYRNITRGDFV